MDGDTSSPRQVPPSWSPLRRLREALSLARADAGTPAVMALAAFARTYSDPLSRAVACLASVQALPYVYDPPGEWLQPGAFTATHGGDCEDLAALLVAVLGLVGLRAEVVWLSQPSALRDHVTVRAFIDGAWWWAEPTVKGALFGEDPYSAAARVGRRDTVQ